MRGGSGSGSLPCRWPSGHTPEFCSRKIVRPLLASFGAAHPLGGERRPTAGDRRSHAIYLTPEGRRSADAALDIQRAFVAETFGRLAPEEIARLENLIAKVRDFTREATAARRVS